MTEVKDSQIETEPGNPFFSTGVSRWPSVSLIQVTELITRGRAPSYLDQSDVFAIGQRCVTDDGFNPMMARPHDDLFMDRAVVARPGDFLLNSTGSGTIGRSCVFSARGRYIIDSHVTVVRPWDDVLEGAWLDILFRSSWGQEHLATRCYSGSTNQIELSVSRLAAMRIPLPPLAEQRAVVAVMKVLDSVVRKADGARDKLESVGGAILDEFLSRSWPIRILSEVGTVGSGLTLGKKLSGPGVVSMPYLRVANVKDGFVDLSDVKQVSVQSSDIERFTLRVGDVLMTEGGDYDKLGRGAVWDGQVEPCLHQNHIFRVRCDRNLILPEFLSAYSGSPAGRKWFVQVSRQTTNLASISKSQLSRFPIPCPPVHDQACLLERLAAVRSAVQCARVESEKLRRFRHGLVADLLTERVRARKVAS